MQPQLTPLMRQYFEIKAQHPQTILLFQVGDFYELFFDDAIIASKTLLITLTQRGTDAQGEPIPLCGVPVHVIDTYIAKLVKAGFRVALCQQLTEPRPGKVVERGVTQVLTPGTLTDMKLLDDKAASYMCVLYPTNQTITLLFVELLTGQLSITHVPDDQRHLLEAELSRFLPDEIIVPQSKHGALLAPVIQGLGYIVSMESCELYLNERMDDTKAWLQQLDHNRTWDAEVVEAVSVLYGFLKRNNERALGFIKSIQWYRVDDYLLLDAATQRNLEIVKNNSDSTIAYTLFSVIDRAVTSMGSRTLKKWLLRPLIDVAQINDRLDAISGFNEHGRVCADVRQLFKQVPDVERIVGRIALKRAHLYDYAALVGALEVLPAIEQVIEHVDVSLIKLMRGYLGEFAQLKKLLHDSLNLDNTKNWIIKEGYHADLDRLRSLVDNGARAILELEQKEIARTGISSLKIRFNGVHGYGIEITKPNLHLAPVDYIRTQTLANRERFTMQALKDLEYDMQRAQTHIGEIEKEVFESIKRQVEQYVPELKRCAHALGHLDALCALSHSAIEYQYVRPTFNHAQDIIIDQGRHPIVEQQIKHGFIANSIALTDQSSLWIITGPNMGGKSTFLRQTALISIMAQMGSFVPARSANLAIIDRIFTRIGAADKVAEGKSTFLVEMEETALICNHATSRSLVILDEVGRGTSTYDGLAIAQAVVEYIHDHVKARCLFATHYHELTDLENTLSGIACYYAASTKTMQGILLLHKILPGVAAGSFGLEVARLAQLPKPIVDRAQEILTGLSAQRQHISADAVLVNAAQSDVMLRQQIAELQAYQAQQERIFEHEHAIIAQLESLDPDMITPKQALDILCALKQKI